jgi:hypothetical protein
MLAEGRVPHDLFYLFVVGDTSQLFLHRLCDLDAAVIWHVWHGRALFCPLGRLICTPKFIIP